MGNKHDGTLKILKEKSDKIEKQVKSLTADQLSTVQDITRNTGRLNKVELDIKKMGSKVVDIESEQQKEGGKLEADVVNVKKLAGTKFVQRWRERINLSVEMREERKCSNYT